MSPFPADDEEYFVETRDAWPAHLLTEIKSFSILSKHKIKMLESAEFKAGDYKWKLITNLDGGDHISVKLCIVGTNSLPAGWEVNAIFNFFLYHHISDKYVRFQGKARRFHATHSEWGFSKLITKKCLTDPCNGFLIEDKCVFGAEVFVNKKQPLIENVSLLRLSTNFSKLESKSQELSARGNKWIYSNASLIKDMRPLCLHILEACASLFCLRNMFEYQKHHAKEEYTLETRHASPTHLLTTIESFSLLLKHKIQLFESAVFEAGDYKWKVIMNVDGGGHISVKLCIVGTDSLPAGWEVNAIFNFFLYNHFSDKYHCFRGKARRFHAINPEWGFSKFTTKKSLTEPCDRFVFKDKCVFGAEVTVIKKQPLIQKVSVLRLSNPYKREWKISKFSKMEENWKSEEFSAGGYKWIVEIYPNGSTITRGRYVSIFLECVDAKSFSDGKKVNAACQFCFRNKLNDKNDNSLKATWFSSAIPCWGFNRFMAIDDMLDPSKGFVVDDCCNLEVQLSVQALQELK